MIKRRQVGDGEEFNLVLQWNAIWDEWGEVKRYIE